MRFNASALLINAIFITSMPMAIADPAALAQKKGCMGCHAIDHKVVGPAYKDVVAKYKGQADAAARLAKKIKEGGSGSWGNTPMPPNVVTDEEAVTLAEWVLSH